MSKHAAMARQVFVVEDSLSIRRQLVQRLEGVAGLRVVGESGEVEQARALIAWTQPDVVLLDLSLAQGGSGLALLKQLRREDFAGQVLVMSHQMADTYRDACLAVGADGFFDKSAGLDDLLAHLGAAPTPCLGGPALLERLDQVLKMVGRDGGELAVYELALADQPEAGLDAAVRRLTELLDPGDMLARPAPGRLVVVLTRLEAAAEAGEFATRLARWVAEALGAELALVRARLGMALFPWEGSAATALLSLAEARAAGAVPAAGAEGSPAPSPFAG